MEVPDLNYSTDMDSDSDTSQSLISQNERNPDGDETPRPQNSSQKRIILTPTWSRVNDHFTKVDDGNKCNYCERVLKFEKNSGTSSRLRHMKSFHHDKNSQNSSNFSQENFEDILVKLIISANLPFTIVENELFQNLLYICNDRAKLPSANTLRSKIFKMYEEKKTQIKEEFQSIPGKISISIDGWSARNMISFQGVIAEFLDKDFNRKVIALDLSVLGISHSGESLSIKLIEVLTEFEILNKVICIGSDNVKESDTLMRHFANHLTNVLNIKFEEKSRTRCMAHIVNLACQIAIKQLKSTNLQNTDAQDLILDQDVIEIINNLDGQNENIEIEVPENIDSNDILKKLRFGTIKIKSSSIRRVKFVDICKNEDLEPLSLILDVQTRWNSTFLMIKRAIYLKDAYETIMISETKLEKYSLSNSEWEKLKLMQLLLEPFYETTLQLSKQDQTISFIGVAFMHMFNNLDKYIINSSNSQSGIDPTTNFLYPRWLRSAAEAAKEKLEEYFGIIDWELYIISIVLDPRLKLKWFIEGAKISKSLVNTRYKSQIRKIWNLYKSSEPEPVQDIPPNEPPIKQHKSFFSLQMSTSNELDPIDEFENYIKSPVIEDEENFSVLKWWHENQTKFPIWSKMSRDYFASSGSNVSIERFFSLGTDFITPKRSNLISETINKCLVLKTWI